jgi:hypothetical protein
MEISSAIAAGRTRALVVVGVLADQVHPPGGSDDEHRILAGAPCLEQHPPEAGRVRRLLAHTAERIRASPGA